jgi:hypothetical protein
MYLLMYIRRKEKQNFKYPKVIFSVVPIKIRLDSKKPKDITSK